MFRVKLATGRRDGEKAKEHTPVANLGTDHDEGSEAHRVAVSGVSVETFNGHCKDYDIWSCRRVSQCRRVTLAERNFLNEMCWDVDVGRLLPTVGQYVPTFADEPSRLGSGAGCGHSLKLVAILRLVFEPLDVGL